MSTTTELRAEAEHTLLTLDALHYKPHVVGGVLRVEALGGETTDIDIALLLHQAEVKSAISIMERLGFEVQHEHSPVYTGQTGFFADLRSGNVNIIIYDAAMYHDVQQLVKSFDLNINKYYEHAGTVHNDCFDGTFVEYTASSQHIFKPERIVRFRDEYPTLNWCRVPTVMDLKEFFDE